MFVVQMQHAEAQAWTEIAEWHPRHPKPVVHNAWGAENHVGASAAKPVAEPAEATEKDFCYIKNIKIYKKHILTP